MSYVATKFVGPLWRFKLTKMTKLFYYRKNHQIMVQKGVYLRSLKFLNVTTLIGVKNHPRKHVFEEI